MKGDLKRRAIVRIAEGKIELLMNKTYRETGSNFGVQ